MVQTLETFKDIDKATIASTVEPPATSNQQEDDGFAKTSKWLKDHDVESQTKRLAPQKDRVNNEDEFDSAATEKKTCSAENNQIPVEDLNPESSSKYKIDSLQSALDLTMTQ